MLKNETTRKQEIKSGANANDHDEGCSSTVIGGMVMEEGLRCSRSNGKQWRCLQPHLEGYSKSPFGPAIYKGKRALLIETTIFQSFGLVILVKSCF
jgi:hypothetical protein